MSERFTEVPSGVKWFKDNATGLEWSGTAPRTMKWEDAIDWCVSVGGRLPTRVELLTLVDDSLYDPCTKIPSSRSCNYWSASTYKPNPGFAWFVGVSDGYVFADNKIFTGFVRAVRKAS